MVLNNGIIDRWNKELNLRMSVRSYPSILIKQDRIIHNTITSIKTNQSSCDPAHIFQGFFIST